MTNIPSPSEIDMLREPDLGQSAIDSIYQQTSVLQKPERFGIVIQFYSTNRTLPPDDCLKEWIILYTRFSGHFAHSTPRCFCSQSISRLFFIQNKYNGNILLIGADCIKKFGSDSLKSEKQTMGKFYRHCNHCGQSTLFTEIVDGNCQNCSEGLDKEKRCCHSCLKLCKIIKGNLRCKTCIQLGKPRIEICKFEKTCENCQKIFYVADDFKTICSDCYQSGKIYLNVPYNQKDQAKTIFGARWEPARRKWWVRRNANFPNMPQAWLST